MSGTTYRSSEAISGSASDAQSLGCGIPSDRHLLYTEYPNFQASLAVIKGEGKKHVHGVVQKECFHWKTVVRGV